LVKSWLIRISVNGRLAPVMLARLRVPIYFPIAFRSASLILSCQPGPASWK
jgi:hypothetical protein